MYAFDKLSEWGPGRPGKEGSSCVPSYTNYMDGVLELDLVGGSVASHGCIRGDSRMATRPGGPVGFVVCDRGAWQYDH